jgi:hypothetical protein
MTELRFNGDVALWVGLLLALILGGGAAMFYWRESRTRPGMLRWLLPALRGIAIVLLLLILTGPVLRRSEMVGEVGRVLLLVDASKSMSLTDASTEAHRKLLIAQELGWARAGSYDPQLRLAIGAITEARTAAGNLGRRPSDEVVRAAATNANAFLDVAAGHLSQVAPATVPGIGDLALKFDRDVRQPTTQLASGARLRAGKKPATELAAIHAALGRWEQTFQNAYDDYLRRLSTSGDASVQRALREFDDRTRWQRLQSLLLSNNLLSGIAGKHRVEILIPGVAAPQVVWQGDPASLTEEENLPTELDAAPTNSATDLGTFLRQASENLPTTERTAFVLFSDGQHNSGESPAPLARVFGNRSLPVLTVGYGSTTRPEDLALVAINGPKTVFIEDKAKGELVIKDELPVGQNFVLKLEAGGKAVWAATLPAQGKARRNIPFEFPVKELAQFGGGNGLKQSAVPIALRASIAAVGAEKETNNNAMAFRFLAVNQRPKVLVLDGRPRWEFRYLRNLFERDAQWEVNSLLVGSGGGETRPWPRGPGVGQFPADRETLFGYQLIVFGDLPPGFLRNDELTWLKEFVEKHGGGILFVDGRQEQLANYANGPLAPLLPVGWSGGPLEGDAIKLVLTTPGGEATPLRLVSGATENATVWNKLPVPRWVAGTTELPGAEVLMRATLGERAVPAFAFRRYGAGRVFYSAFEESWRWRYEVADQYHQRFWNQVFRWIMDAPYAVSDKYVSLDAGAASYAPREPAELRVQVRDAEGRMMPKAKVEAQLFRAGVKVASIPLTSDEADSGVYRGRTAELTEGDYEVRVRVDGLPEAEMKARVSFVVEPKDAGELAELTCNEALLREIAVNSGGEYFREEDATRVIERLAPLSRGQVVETETVLWQSPWWFGAVVALLTVEWFLRKRNGMM